MRPTQPSDQRRHVAQEVGRAACGAGADLLNDTWSGWDPKLAEVAGDFGVGLVCSHTGGMQPRTRVFRTAYADVMADVLDRTLSLAQRAMQAGVGPSRILIDPAHDFGKNTWHSLEISRRLAAMTATGWPVLMSVSNKDFVGEARARASRTAWRARWLSPGVAWLGARVFRAHHVGQTRQALDMVAAIKGDSQPARVLRGWSSNAAAGGSAVHAAAGDSAVHAAAGDSAVIIRAALCPSPPLLARELTGRDPLVSGLREACAEATARLVDADPDVIIIVGSASETSGWDSASRVDLSAFAPALEAGGTPGLPLSLGLGALLLDRAWRTPGRGSCRRSASASRRRAAPSSVTSSRRPGAAPPCSCWGTAVRAEPHRPGPLGRTRRPVRRPGRAGHPGWRPGRPDRG